MPAARWPTSRRFDLLEIDVPIVQARMAGAQGSALASAVSAAGGLGSLPCAMLTVEDARVEVARLRAATNRGFQMNFFCHTPPDPNPETEQRWRERVAQRRRCRRAADRRRAPNSRARAKAEAEGSSDFSPLWTGQAGPLAREMPAGALTTLLAEDALRRLATLAG